MSKTEHQTNPELADDTFVWGAAQIAKVLGINTRKAFYLLETGRIRATKRGAQWVASRRLLREDVLNDIQRVQLKSNKVKTASNGLRT
jgi:hypothetical protein